MQDVLRTGPNAFSKLEGADAIQAAGATTETLKKMKADIFGQAANGYQRDRLGPILDTHLASAIEQIARHVDRQQEVYDRNVAAAAVKVAEREARSNPDNLPGAATRARDFARLLVKGQAPEVVESESRKAVSRILSSVITDRLATDDPSAVPLYRQYRNRLEPADRLALGSAVETLSNTLDAAAWLRERSATLRPPAPTGDAALDAVNAGSASTAEPPAVVSSGGALLDPDGGIVGTRQRLADIEERHRALTALNQQEFAADPARLRANQAAIDTDTVRSRAAEKAETDGLYADLRRHLTTGGPDGGPALTPPPATIMSRLTDAQQDSVTAQVKANIAGRRTVSDPQTRYAIRYGLTADDAGERQRWAATSLVPFMGRLSAGDYAALEALQSAVRDDGGSADQDRLRNVTRMADRVLRSAGIDPTPRPDAAPGSGAAQAEQFHRTLQNEMSAFESRGHAPTESEAYGIVNGLKDTAIKSGWLKVRDAPPSVMSDYQSTDEAFHGDGAQIAQAEPAEPKPGTVMRLAPDFESFRRQMEEARQREAAERAAAGTGGAGGVPATEPDPGSPEYQAADEQARQIVAEQAAEGSGGQGIAPATEPPPGSPEHQAAEEQARKLGEGDWDNLGVFEQLGIAFRRFDQESRKSGAALSVDSGAGHLETVLELQRRQNAGEELNVTEKRYLLKNRNVPSDLADAVGRLVDAQRRLDELPASDPLRQLFEAPSVAEAARLLRQNPGRIARATGIEGVPGLTVSLIATAVLGPIGGALTLTGTSGLDGYAKGLVGALDRAGVDVSNAEDLTRALQDKELMERVRKDATTEGAIAAGVSAMATLIPGSKRPSFVRGPGGTSIPVPPGLNDGEFELFKYGARNSLQWNSKTSRRILSNLDMQVDRFLGQYRQGRIIGEFPSQFRKGTLRELYDSPASDAKDTALKLLKNRRFERE